jgi:hypothetical protein
MINETYIKLIIKQIKNGINEDQALDIIKELIKNRGEEPERQITNAEKKHLYWDFNNANTTSHSQNWIETVTILDMEGLE